MANEPLDELLGAYALDAVDDDERRQVEAYIEADPRARAEVEAHRQVAALLAVSGERPPEGLWDRIAGALEEPPPAPGPRLAQVMPMEPRRRRRSALGAAAAAAVAAAAAIAITLVVVDDDGGPTEVAGGDAVTAGYGEAWADPDGRRVRLEGEGATFSADAVVLPDGTGYLAANGLPELPESETWQLWGVFDDDDVISLGVLGHRPGIEAFTASDGVTTLVITREQAGGVAQSTTGAVLAGSF